MTDYLTDPNLKDNEARGMLLIKRLIKDDEYLLCTNEKLGEMLGGKSISATAKIIFHLCRKGYLRSEQPSKGRRLYILK